MKTLRIESTTGVKLDANDQRKAIKAAECVLRGSRCEGTGLWRAAEAEAIDAITADWHQSGDHGFVLVAE